MVQFLVNFLCHLRIVFRFVRFQSFKKTLSFGSHFLEALFLLSTVFEAGIGVDEAVTSHFVNFELFGLLTINFHSLLKSLMEVLKWIFGYFLLEIEEAGLGSISSRRSCLVDLAFECLP